jgi:hypothetical protein
MVDLTGLVKGTSLEACKAMVQAAFLSDEYRPRILQAYVTFSVPKLTPKAVLAKAGGGPRVDWSLEMLPKGAGGMGWQAFCKGLRMGAVGEATAGAILGDLSKQRETLNHARGTLKFATDGLDRSRKLLNAMARRAAMNKLTMYGVIALLVGMLLLLLWASGGGGGSAPAPAAAASTEGGWQKAP